MYHNSTSHKVSTSQICQILQGAPKNNFMNISMFDCYLSMLQFTFVSMLFCLMEGIGLGLAFITKSICDPLGTKLGRDLDLAPYQQGQSQLPMQQLSALHLKIVN